MFNRRHGLAFELTHMRSSVEAHITHTLSMNAIEHTYVRSIACVLNPHVTLYRSLSSFSPSFLHCAVQSLFLFLSSYLTPPLRITIPLPKHFPITSIAPPRRRRTTTAFLSPHFYISPFLPHFLTNPTSPKNSHFVLDFECPKAQIHPQIVRFCFLCWLFLILQGVRVDFRGVLKPLLLEAPNKCLTKFPNEFPACLEGKYHLLSPLGPKPW